MKRAVRAIHPSLRRHRRIERVNKFDNSQARQMNGLNCHRCSFSSITFNGGDNLQVGNGNRSGRSGLREKQSRRRRRDQRHGPGAQSSLRTFGGDISVFATIHEAQDSMQDLLDRLVDVDKNASSSGISQHDGIAPITVQALASNDIPGVDSDFDYRRWKLRADIFREAGEFFNALVQSVNEGHLSPSRKHGKELSQLAECLLYVCGQQQPCYIEVSNPDNDASNNHSTIRNENTELDAGEVIGAIKEVLRVLEVDWNLDVSHRHYEHAIAAACNWREWEIASSLFEKQIDPNAGGSPVRLSVENPLGLFAITQRYQQTTEIESGNSSVDQEPNLHEALHKNEETVSMIAEHVMDAVQRLVMVSPQDQNTYVLAAGNALGYAGCWREFNDFRKSTFLSQQYGIPLVAAVLRACLLCGEYEAALEILVEENLLSPSTTPSPQNTDPFSPSRNLEEEWQWGGARDRMDPLVRDLAMQVIGATCATRSNEESHNWVHEFDSRSALNLFRQSREEGVTISHEALLGVAEACEADKDWRSALSVLRTVLEEDDRNTENYNTTTSKIAPWIVPSKTLAITERDQIGSTDVLDGKSIGKTFLPDLGSFLASIMRNCNSTSNFGLALFGLQLFRNQLLRSLSNGENRNKLSPEEEISEMISHLNLTGSSQQHEELLIASMVALTGLRCHKNSIRLYEISTSRIESEGADLESSGASLMYKYASLNQKRHGTSVLGNSWLSAHDHINNLTDASVLVRKILEAKDSGIPGAKGGDSALKEHQRKGIQEILARAMNSCTNAHQPELSLYLLRWMEDSVFSCRGTLTHPSNESIIASNDTLVNYGDSVIAETILALRWTKDLVGAIGMFEEILEKHAEDDLVKWRKTIVAGLTAMVASGRGSDAVKVFEVLDGNARSTACYTTIGRHLSKVKDWKELIDLYRDATVEGYSSEELSLLAMLAVTSTRVDNRLRILRAIVDDCAMNVGLDPKRWTMTKYWKIKRTLGFYHARLLMWWNDEERAPLDEINLAIKEFYNEKANGMRPKNDVVRAIVTGASKHDSLGLELEGGYEKVPRSELHWVELIDDVLETVKESPVRFDPNFVDSVVKAYKSLGRSKECVDYISDVIEVDGTRIRKSTLAEILEAAKLEHAYSLQNNIEMLLSRGTSLQDGPNVQSLRR